MQKEKSSKTLDKSSSKKYLTNKDLYIEIIVSKAQGHLTREAERMLILLAKNVHKKFYYRSMEDKEDCLQQSLLDVLSYWRNFDEEKTTNAFAYFTEIIKRGHAKGWRNLNKNREEFSLNQFYDKGDGDLNI